MKITYSIKMKCLTSHTHKKPRCGTKVLHSWHEQLGGTHFLIFTLKTSQDVVFFKSTGILPQIFGPIDLSVPRPYFTVCIRIMVVIETCD